MDPRDLIPKPSVEPAPDYHVQNALRNQCEVVPDRATVINDDDITNLIIALNTAKSIEELEELV